MWKSDLEKVENSLNFLQGEKVSSISVHCRLIEMNQNGKGPIQSTNLQN